MPMSFTSNPLPRSTFVNLPSSPPVGYMAFATDWGTNGTFAWWDGLRWRAVGGSTILTISNAVTGITNTPETIAAQALMPIGSMKTGDFIKLEGSFSKSGTTDTLQLSFRVGVLGTVADQGLTGLTLANQLSATNLSGGPIDKIRIVSNTSMERLGSGAAGGSGYGLINTTALAAVTTGLADFSTTAVTLTVSLKSSSTNDTVSAQEVTLSHITG